MEGSSGLEGSMQAAYEYLEQAFELNDSFEEDLLLAISADKIEEWKQVVDGSPLKWTEETARLLITAVSYVVEAASLEFNVDERGQKLRFAPITTKWEVISSVMGERGFNFSPQQCEDKFNDINKRYRQLVGILGKPTSCNVVEKPTLLESIDMPEQEKEEVRRLLSSEHFLYQEMCSLHHRNRLFLPHDRELRKSVMLKLGLNKVEMGQSQSDEMKRWMKKEEEKLEMQKQMVQLVKQRCDWLRVKYIEEMKVQEMRLRNENLKLSNDLLAFELKCREMGIGGRRA